MAWVTGRYAARSLRRNVRRSLLAVIGIAIGCGLALVMEGFNRGRDELFARAGASSGAGHLHVVPAGWRGSRDAKLRLVDGEHDLAASLASPVVAAAAPRVRAMGLVAMGTHVNAVQITGVDPMLEPSTDRFVRTITRGRYLQSGERGALVIGQTLADRLGVDLDDEVLASVVGPDGNIDSAMFKVVGLVRTGSEELDLTICQAPLADVTALTGRPGIGEIAIVLRDWHAIDAARAAIAPAVAPTDDVMTWDELSPDFKGHMKQDQTMSRVITGIILLIVLLGVMSAQLAAVLERRREFAVLAALGMTGWRMTALVVLEAMTLGLAGGLGGLLLGGPVVYWLARHGLDLGKLYGGNFSIGGAFIEPIIYMDFGLWVVPYSVVLAIVATIAASLYPAIFAARTDPAAALRVAQ